MKSYGWLLFGLLLLLFGCQRARPTSEVTTPPTTPPSTPAPTTPQAAAATLRLTSPAFGYGQPIPDRYTCQGQDRIPPLRWQGVPQEAQSLVLIMEDPDAPMGTWDHWVVYDIPTSVWEVKEGQAPPGKMGRNSWGRLGYGGPCPPPGPAHRYFFRLYALDVPSLGLPEGATKAQVLEAMQGHVLAQAEWMGTYQR